MNRIYICLITWGSYADKEQRIVYAGDSLMDAEIAMWRFPFPEFATNKIGHIQKWEDGVERKELEETYYL